jgi:hypothetical protein
MSKRVETIKIASGHWMMKGVTMKGLLLIEGKDIE